MVAIITVIVPENVKLKALGLSPLLMVMQGSIIWCMVSDVSVLLNYCYINGEALIVMGLDSKSTVIPSSCNLLQLYYLYNPVILPTALNC